MDAELKQQLDRIEKFLLEHVVTREELLEHVRRLEEKMATKASMENLRDSVDKFAKTVKNFEQEHLALKEQMSTVQGWIRSAAKRLDIEFKL